MVFLYSWDGWCCPGVSWSKPKHSLETELLPSCWMLSSSFHSQLHTHHEVKNIQILKSHCIKRVRYHIIISIYFFYILMFKYGSERYYQPLEIVHASSSSLTVWKDLILHNLVLLITAAHFLKTQWLTVQSMQSRGNTFLLIFITFWDAQIQPNKSNSVWLLVQT